MMLLIATTLMFFPLADAGPDGSAATATVPHWRDLLKIGMSWKEVEEKIGRSYNIDIHGIGQMNVYFIELGICLEFNSKGRLEKIVNLISISL